MRQMKDSGIKWIGEIPASWQLDRMGMMFYERSEKVSDADYVPLSVTKKGVLDQLAHVAKSDDHSNRKLVCLGDFAINSRSDRRNSCGFAPKDGSVSLINIVLAPMVEMCSSYFDYVFDTVQFGDEFYRLGHGIVADLWTTKWIEAKRIELPFPDLEEQKLIVSFLDSECAEIDKAIEAAEASIEEYKLYKKSVIFQAVTKGLDPDAPMKDSGVDHFGVIPTHWTTVPLKRVAHEIKKGISPSYSAEGAAFVVKQASFSHGFLDWSKVDRADAASCAKKGLLHKNDVLIATTGGGVLGKVYCLEIDRALYASTDVGVISVNSERYEYRLLYHFLSVNYENINGTMATGSTNQTHLQMRAFSDMQIPLPPRKEQVELVRRLDQRAKDIDDAIASKQQIIDELKAYKKSLIWEVVTGKREVPCP